MIRLILAVLAAALFLILGLPLLGITYLLDKKDHKKGNRIATAAVYWIFRVIGKICTVKLEVKGRENLLPDQPVLYIANHASIFDVIMTYPVLPAPVGFIAKKEVKKIPILPVWFTLLDGLFIDRGDNKQSLQTILAAIDKVKNGSSIFIFPEGTRTKTGEMSEFKAGSFKVATRTNCPIIPIAITGTANILKKHIPFIKSSKVTIQIGEPIYLDQLTPEEKKHIAPLAQAKVQAMLDQEK